MMMKVGIEHGLTHSISELVYVPIEARTDCSEVRTLISVDMEAAKSLDVGRRELEVVSRVLVSTRCSP